MSSQTQLGRTWSSSYSLTRYSSGPHKMMCHFCTHHLQFNFIWSRSSLYLSRDETIWRYIDTVSIQRLTIRIVAQRDISRYDLGICNQGKSPRCLYFCIWRVFRFRSRNTISVGVVYVNACWNGPLSGLFFIYSGLRWSKVTVLKKCFLRSNFHSLVKPFIV